ncbi:MAG: hypothetical protein L3K23_10585 [Thermoplasmata archaeon]|nr:hypothetical protein [Thermoplasmata archaeon]
MSSGAERPPCGVAGFRRNSRTLVSVAVVVAVASLAISLGLPGPVVPPSGLQYAAALRGLASVAVPPDSSSANMVYDAADRYVVLFGGLTATSGIGGSNQTWTYSNGTWSQLHPAVSPPGRAWAMMAYDSSDGYAVLFGGLNASPAYHDLHDTWIFKGGNWTQLHLSVHPSARDSGMMAYDSTDGYVVLFGGAVKPHTRPLPLQNSTVYYNDTWTFSGGHWHNAPTASRGNPIAPRAEGLLSDNPSGHGVYLLGGLVKSGPGRALGAQQPWAFSAGLWSRTSLCTLPANRTCWSGASTGAMAYDAHSSQLVLFETNIQIYCPGQIGSMTLERSGGIWSVTQVCKGTPPARFWPAMTYDGADRYMLLFGGAGQSSTNYTIDTWAFHNGTWHVV